MIRFSKSLTGSLTNFSVKIGGAVLAFLLNITIARLLTISDAGTLFILISINTVMFSVARFGLGYLTYRTIAEISSKINGNAISEHIEIIFVSVTIVSVFATVLLNLSAEPISLILFHRADFAWMIRVISLAVPLYCIGSVLSEVLKGAQHPTAFAFFENIIIKASSIPFVFLGAKFFGLPGSILAIVTANFVGFLYSLFAVMHLLNVRLFMGFFRSEQLLMSSFAYLRNAPYFAFYSLGTVTLLWGGTVMVGTALGSEDAAIFFSAFRVAATVEFASAAIVAVAGPELVVLAGAKSLSDFVMKTKHILIFTSVATLVIVTILSLFSNFIMELFGKQYTSGSSTLRVLLIFFGVYGVFQVFSAAAIALKMERKIALIYLFTSPVSLFSTYFAAKHFGLEGAVIGFGCSLVFSSMVVGLLVIKKIRSVS